MNTGMEVTFERVSTNGIKLHTALAGPEDGEPVILLHGFPDAWFGWEPQIQALAEAGFRVIAPDQRGYNLSDKPKGIANYSLEILAADIAGLADSLGVKRFNLAGHDFGGLVSWKMATRYPDRLKRLAILNVPHPSVMRRYIRKHPAQVLKSWYAFFYQLPVLPEMAMRANRWRFLISAMAKGLSKEQRNRYREAWAQPDAMKSMINWYRNMLRASASKPSKRPAITAPTLVIWGKLDPYISYEMAQPSADMCTDGRLITVEKATHWVMMDAPDEVNRLLIEHFRL
jgi:pimeloyl-ACP methyl ester carboxylesterase